MSPSSAADRAIIHAAVIQLTELMWEMRRGGKDSTAVEAHLRLLATKLARA
jgi:hypothetical protein